MRYHRDEDSNTEQQEPLKLLSDETTGTSMIYGRIIPGNYEFAPEINDFEVFDAALQVIIYTVRRDQRKCASPLCGGFWLRSSWTTKTTCSDGLLADECYVANLNLSGHNLMPEREQAFLNLVLGEGGSVLGYYIDNPAYATTSWPDLKDLYFVNGEGDKDKYFTIPQ